MDTIPVTAGEVLEIGDLVFIKDKLAYKIYDETQIPRGIISKHLEKSDVVDVFIVQAIIAESRIRGVNIGYAGEDLVAGGAIELHADGNWYNKRGED